MLDHLTSLFDECAQRFRHTLARRPSGGALPLPIYFSLYAVQRALWNWGIVRYAQHGDADSLRRAAFLVSRVACLKLAALPEPFAPPSAGRDYWDRLFSLAAGDRAALDAHARHMPDDAYRGYNYPNRLHRLLDAAITGRGLRTSEALHDFDRMKPLYLGPLHALVGITQRDMRRVREGLGYLTRDSSAFARSMMWVQHRDVLCPAAFGIARLAHETMNLWFEGEAPGNTSWWNEDLLIPLPEAEQLSVLENLDRIVPGLAEMAVELPQRLSFRAA